MKTLVLTLFIIAGMTLPLMATEQFKKGQCIYERFPTKVQITSVKQLDSTSSPKFEVRFKVLNTQGLPAKAENIVYGRDFHLLLMNKTFPDPLFLKKYDITTEKIFECDLNVLIKGNCKRSFFEFPDIKLDDYAGS